MSSPATISTIDTASPFDPRTLRNALGTYGTGVAVVTAVGLDGEWVGLTINSFSSVSLDPPLVLWSIDNNSPSLPVFETTSHYAVSVLSESQEELSNRFASRVPDKFEGLDCPVGTSGSPLIPDALAWFECRIMQRIAAGDHTILLGHVERFAFDARSAPLLFQAGSYRRIA